MHSLIQQQQQQQHGRILLLLLVVNIILVPLLSSFQERDSIFVEALSAQSQTSAQQPQQQQLFTHKGWRIAMNIGREPETNGMVSSEWAKSGCRLPVIAQCDFQQQESNDDKKKQTTTTGIVVPLTNDIRYTGPDGEIIKPIQGGEWSLNNNSNDSQSNKNELSFYMNFPEELIRRDVIINAGAILRLEGIMYSTTQLKEMNTNFYTARDQKWDAGEELNSIEKRRTAPLKWNPNQNKWEKESFPEDTILVRLQKETNLKRAEQKIKEINQERPNPKDISLDCGPFPGIVDDDGDGDGDVYFRKKGKVLLQSGGNGGIFGQWSINKQCVIGTWSAEPINDKPLSYY